MGLSTSCHIASSPPSSSSRKPSGSLSKLKSTKNKLSSFLICGSSTSQLPFEIEDYPEVSPINSLENLAPDSSSNFVAQSSTIFGSETGSTSSKPETGSTSSSIGITQNTYVEYAMTDREANGHQTFLPNNTDSVSNQPSQDLVPANVSSVDAHILLKEGASSVCSENEHPSNVAQAFGSFYPDGSCVENHDVAIGDSESSDYRSLPLSPDSIGSLQLSGCGNSETATSSSSRIRMSGSERDLGRGDVLHADVETLSRRSFGRISDFPTIVFATGPADDLGSDDRWLLNFSGDLRYDGGLHDSVYRGARSNLRNGRRWLLRSEISERVVHGYGGGGRRTDFCASGLHPDGTCSCESFFSAEESSTLASISRIIILAEALFEVLDEIHQQPLSFSLSMLTLPAPEYVVDSFPLKYHKKIDDTESRLSDVPQSNSGDKSLLECLLVFLSTVRKKQDYKRISIAKFSAVKL